MIAGAGEGLHRAAKLRDAAGALREQARSKMTDKERVEHNGSEAALRGVLPAAEFDACWKENHALSMEQAIQFALAENK